MQFDKKIIMAMAAIAVMLSVPFVCSDSDADPSYTQDYGEFYSYTLQFLFDGSDAQSDLRRERDMGRCSRREYPV